MIGSRIVQLGCIGLALAATAAYADRSLRLSARHLVAESSEVIVTHDHDVQQVKDPSVPHEGILLDLRSTLRIVRKSDNTEIFYQRVMPLTTLASVDDGQYFAGLSSLRALSFEYNFLLISAEGEIITTALITPTSDHCRVVSYTTTNSIRWFEEDTPDIALSFKGDRVDTITVVNPYDRGPYGQGVGTCVIRVAS